MSESLSLPKVKLISPDKRKIHYEKILSETPVNNTDANKNKIKNIQIKKNNNSNKNISIDNMQTIEAICNIIDLINDNNLNIIYKEDSSNFKRNIDQLNLKFYLETEKIISSNQNKSKEENTSFNSNKLFLILFKQINLYIKEIERLNGLIINSVKDADNMKKKMAIFIRKQNDFETKEQIIRALKFSLNSLEKKLSNVLLSENNLRQEIQKLKKEKDFYYEYYKSSKTSNNNKNNPFNKSQTINDLKQNNNQHLKHNTKDNFFNNSKGVILLNDSQNNNILGNDHKRNNSENDNHSKNNNNSGVPGSLQKYYNGSPKRKAKNTINIKGNGNNANGPKSIIRLCNYYSHNIEIDLPLGFKSKSPGKNYQSNQIKDVQLVKGRKSGGEKSLFQKSNIMNENKLDVNIVNNNNNTFIFENSFIHRNKTIYNTINPNKDLSISRLFKNRTNSDKYNEEEKSKNNIINSTSLNKESKGKELDTDIANLSELENLLIEVKDYILNNENKNNNNNSNNNNNGNKNAHFKKKNNSKNKSNSIQNNNIIKRNSNYNNFK